MKSNISIKRFFVMIGFALISTSILIGCSDDDGGAAAPPSQGYHYVNGQCYDNQNRVVSQTYCSGLNNCSNNNNNGYQLYNGQCYDQYNRPANPSYCQQSSNNNGYQLYNGQCYDQYNRQVDPSYCQNTGNNNCTGSTGTTVGTGTGNTGGTCSDGVNIPGYGCIPRGGCSTGYVMWYGQCTYVGQ